MWWRKSYGQKPDLAGSSGPVSRIFTTVANKVQDLTVFNDLPNREYSPLTKPRGLGARQQSRARYTRSCCAAYVSVHIVQPVSLSSMFFSVVSENSQPSF